MTLPAARITDMTVCSLVTGIVPHVGGPLLPPGDPTVLIGALPSVQTGALAMCVGPPATVVSGSATVLVGGKPAARLTDKTTHGSTIVSGCATVLIG